MVQRKLSELQSECKKLSIQVTMSGKRDSKQDYVDVLANYFYQKDPRKGQYGFEFVLREIHSPMLAQRMNYLTDAEQKEIMRDGSPWVFEEKIDGARILITYHPNEGFDFYSRNISVKDYLPVSYKDTVWLGAIDSNRPNPEDWKGVFKSPFVVDTEVVAKDSHISTVLGKRGVVTATQLQATTALMAMDPTRSIPIQRETGGFIFNIFDVLKVGDQNIMVQPYIERRNIVQKIHRAMVEKQFPAIIPRSTDQYKENFLMDIFAKGGEGVVAKYAQGQYTPTESRGRKGWVKIKRTATTESGEEIDGFITGFLPGAAGSGWENLVGSLEITVFVVRRDGTEYQHPIAMVTNVTLEDRKAMTYYPKEPHKPYLKSEYYGKVVEVTGQDFSARARRLMHASIVRFRPDRNYLSCKLDESVIEKGIL